MSTDPVVEDIVSEIKGSNILGENILPVLMEPQGLGDLLSRWIAISKFPYPAFASTKNCCKVDA
jgi:hypothetical protein